MEGLNRRGGSNGDREDAPTGPEQTIAREPLEAADAPSGAELSEAQVESALAYNRGRGLSQEAWDQIAAIVDCSVSELSAELVRSLAAWQLEMGLEVDGKVDDTTLHRLGREPGAQGLDAPAGGETEGGESSADAGESGAGGDSAGLGLRAPSGANGPASHLLLPGRTPLESVARFKLPLYLDPNFLAWSPDAPELSPHLNLQPRHEPPQPLLAMPFLGEWQDGVNEAVKSGLNGFAGQIRSHAGSDDFDFGHAASAAGTAAAEALGQWVLNRVTSAYFPDGFTFDSIFDFIEEYPLLSGLALVAGTVGGAYYLNHAIDTGATLSVSGGPVKARLNLQSWDVEIQLHFKINF